MKSTTLKYELASPPSIQEAASVLCGVYPTARIVGSVGRNALMNVATQSLKPSGAVRDIDAFGIEPDIHQDAKKAVLPYELDTIYDHWIRTSPNGTWLVYPHNEKIYEEVKDPEEVFKPVDVKIEPQELHVVTLLPQVLAKVSKIMGIERPKDKIAFAEFDQYLFSQKPMINTNLLMPFDTFRSAVRRDRFYLAKAALRNKIYIPLVSEKTRKRIALGEKTHWLRP